MRRDPGVWEHIGGQAISASSGGSTYCPFNRIYIPVRVTLSRKSAEDRTWLSAFSPAKGPEHVLCTSCCECRFEVHQFRSKPHANGALSLHFPPVLHGAISISPLFSATFPVLPVFLTSFFSLALLLSESKPSRLHGAKGSRVASVPSPCAEAQQLAFF